MKKVDLPQSITSIYQLTWENKLVDMLYKYVTQVQGYVIVFKVENESVYSKVYIV